MKQRFLNQKLGKRNSRRAELQKAKTAFSQSKPQPNRPPGARDAHGGKAG
jgi:hypothetical protein